MLSTNYDLKGREFISMVEGRGGLPMWATQFHPEKNIFEWSTKDNIPHSGDAVLTAQVNEGK